MFWYESLLFQCAMTGQRPESMLLVGVGYLGLFGLRFMRGPWSVRECLLRQRTKRRSVWRGAAGDLGAGSFPLDKKGAWCLVFKGADEGLGDGCKVAPVSRF